MTPEAAAHTRRQLIPFAGLSASYFAHIGFFNPYLPLWLKDLGYSLQVIAVLTAVQSATRVFAPYGWGALSDRTGERVKLLRYSATVALISSLGLWFSLSFWPLLLVLVVMFIHTSSMMSMSEAAMAHLVSQGGHFDVGRYGRVRLWGSLGFLLTVLAAGAWFERFGIGHFPGWTLATMLAVFLCVWWLPDIKETVSTQQAHIALWPVLRQAPVLWLFAAVFFHVLAHMGVYIFFSLHLDALGYSKTVIGALWGVSVLMEVLWFFGQGYWLPRFSLTAWLVICAAATVLRMGLTATSAHWMLGLVLAQALHALTFAGHHSICIALLSHHFPGRLRGRGQALYTVIGYGVPGVVGGVLGGQLSAKLGLAAIYWAALAVSLAATVCAWRVWRLQHPAKLG